MSEHGVHTRGQHQQALRREEKDSTSALGLESEHRVKASQTARIELGAEELPDTWV